MDNTTKENVQEKVNIPLDVAMENTRQNIAQILSDSGLPPYLLKYLLSDFINECTAMAESQYKNNLKKYQENIEKNKTDKESV